MTVKRYAANLLYSNTGAPLRNGGVTISENGEIVEVFQLEGNSHECAGVEWCNGILTPGFVNAHTHMELSFFDGIFLPGGSMVAFLKQIDSLRIDINQETIDQALAKGYAALRADGQVAYADISNAADTVPFKKNEAFESVSFVEMFGANRTLADNAFAEGQRVLQEYHSAGITNAFLTPHAPYSVGRELWALLMPELEKAPIFSLHFAETAQEIEFLQTGGGAMATLYRRDWKRETNIPTFDELINNLAQLGRGGKRILLIHCVALTQEMMQRLKADCPQVSLVLCPASNHFIDGSLPNVPLMRREGMHLAVGTDSLSSSPSLSMLDQLRILNRNFPDIPTEELFSWATLGGAEACGFTRLGAIKEGWKPGVNLIEGEGVLQGDLANARVRPLADRHGLIAKS